MPRRFGFRISAWRESLGARVEIGTGPGLERHYGGCKGVNIFNRGIAQGRGSSNGRGSSFQALTSTLAPVVATVERLPHAP